MKIIIRLLLSLALVLIISGCVYPGNTEEYYKRHYVLTPDLDTENNSAPDFIKNYNY